MPLTVTVQEQNQINARISSGANNIIGGVTQNTAIRATVTRDATTLAKVTPTQNILVTSQRMSTNSLTMDDIFDVFSTGAGDGAMLVYNAALQMWEARTTIDNVNTHFNGGHF